jgi:hypothetical protein
MFSAATFVFEFYFYSTVVRQYAGGYFNLLIFVDTCFVILVRYDLFWRKFHGLLRRIYIVLLQDGIFCSCLSGPLDLWCHSILVFLCGFFCLDDLSIDNRGVLKSPTTTVLSPTSFSLLI